MPNEFLPSLLHQLSGNRLGSLLERLQRDAMETDGVDEIGNRHHGGTGTRGDLPDDAVPANTRNESAYYGNEPDDGARLNQRNGDPGTTPQGGNDDGALDLPLSQLESLARNFSAMARKGDPAGQLRGDAPNAGDAELALRSGQLQAGEGIRSAEGHALRSGIANAASSPDGMPSAAATAGSTNAPSGSAQAVASQNAAQLASLERGLQSMQAQTLHSSRSGDAAAPTQRADAVQIPLADRVSATQLQLPGHAVPMIAGRAETAPLPLAPQVAGATVLVNNQVSNSPGALAIGAREGIAPQLRDASLAAAGHTVEGRLRQRQQRRSAGRRAWLEALLLTSRRRATTQDDSAEGTGTPAFQWLFWLLAIVAYAAIAMAIVTLVPSGGGFIDISGRPSFGGIALVGGIGLAIMAWAVARRLIRT